MAAYNDWYPRTAVDFVVALQNPNSPYFKDYIAARQEGNALHALHLILDRWQQRMTAQTEAEKIQFIKDANAASILAMHKLQEATLNLGRPIDQTFQSAKDKAPSTRDELQKLVEKLPQEIAVLKQVQTKLQEEIAATDKELIAANKEWDQKQHQIADEFSEQIQTNPDVKFVDVNNQPIVFNAESLAAIKTVMIRPSPSKVLSVNEGLGKFLFQESKPVGTEAENNNESHLIQNAEWVCNNNICVRTIDAARTLLEMNKSYDQSNGVEEFSITDFFKVITNNFKQNSFKAIAKLKEQESPNVIDILQKEGKKFHCKNQLTDISKEINAREALLETAQARLHPSSHP
jgi:hypothetical protein